MKFGDRLSPALDIGFGKWFTPGIGVRFMYSGLTIKGATQNGSHSTGKCTMLHNGWTNRNSTL